MKKIQTKRRHILKNRIINDDVFYPKISEEKKLWKKGYKFIVGLDEVGRGPLAGPVVAGAVSVDLGFKIYDLRFKIKDSKKLSKKQREYFYEILTNQEQIKWGVGVVSEKVIDKINILNATKLAMQKAINNLSSKFLENSRISFLLIDGNIKLDLSNSDLIKISDASKQKAIVKGDEKVFSITSASIIAKVTRDKIMQKMHKKYPNYGFDKHKGYGTAMHLKNIKKFGPCKIHRKSFYPISSYK